MIKRDNANAGFEFGGINHVALVCADMAKTVDFYSGVLGMFLVMASHSNCLLDRGIRRARCGDGAARTSAGGRPPLTA
jgi:catechol 2,3-dioxygenase-like lactoylglutathione lyase family enzyme